MRRSLVTLGAAGLVAVVVVLVLRPTSSHRIGSPTPTVSYSIVAKQVDRNLLETVFLRYKRVHNEMAATDRVHWSTLDGQSTVGPLLAYEGSSHRFWALANFSLVLPASYRAEVSFQDGGSSAVYWRTAGGPWVMKGQAGFPLCPSVVPAVVAHLWHLTDLPACHS